MNIGEANDLNALLGWILGRRSNGAPVDEADARAAACRLADRACSTILAGYDADRVTARWAIPLGVCSLCPARVPVAELFEHLREMHPGVLAAPSRGPAEARRPVVEMAGPDWDTVVVGGPDPTPDDEPWCENLGDGSHDVACTRRPGHTGRHVAGCGAVVLAVWS